MSAGCASPHHISPKMIPGEVLKGYILVAVKLSHFCPHIQELSDQIKVGKYMRDQCHAPYFNHSMKSCLRCDESC